MPVTVPSLNGLSRITRASIKDLALDQLQRYIRSGVVQPGDRLPAERVLAEQLGVGRSSVREAIKVLEAIGIVETRGGEGTFLAGTADSLGRSLGLSLATWGGTVVEIIGARQIIEVEAARAAAQHATPHDIAALERELLQMEAAHDDFGRYLSADMAFHRAIGQATHNAIIARIIATLVDLLEQTMHDGLGDALPLFAEGTHTHRQVFAAIASHDAPAAAEAMRGHLAFTEELWRIVLSLGATPVEPE